MVPKILNLKKNPNFWICISIKSNWYIGYSQTFCIISLSDQNLGVAKIQSSDFTAYLGSNMLDIKKPLSLVTFNVSTKIKALAKSPKFEQWLFNKRMTEVESSNFTAFLILKILNIKCYGPMVPGS